MHMLRTLIALSFALVAPAWTQSPGAKAPANRQPATRQPAAETPAVRPAANALSAADAALLARFEALAPELQREAVEWFAAECERVPTFQRQLIDHVVRSLGRATYGWPEAPAPATYDPARHAPAQVIPRRFVDAAQGPHRAVVERLLRKVPPRELEPAHTYDWGLGSVVELPGVEHLDPRRVARNAVRGIEPRLDLIEALVTQMLDDGRYRAEAGAFRHAYSDRDGNAYREVTLYDAWASGADMEMPDVECLGIVHDLADDWKRWVAPVPPTQHRALYGWIGERFLPYHRARGLRTALARSFILADPVQRDAYGPAEGRLHAFWERVASDPAALAPTLPDGARWSEWMDREGAAVDNNAELWGKAEARRAALRESQALVRRTFEGIVQELERG